MRAFCCFVGALAMFSSSTAAHAQVMTVKVVPNAFVGIPVKVSVEGGPCGTVHINFGDPNDPVQDNNDTTFTIQTGQLPFSKDHTWHNEGVFTIKATGQVFLGEAELKDDEIVPRLTASAKQGPDERIFVRGDKRVDYGRVAQVMSIVTGGGFKRVALVTEPDQR